MVGSYLRPGVVVVRLDLNLNEPHVSGAGSMRAVYAPSTRSIHAVYAQRTGSMRRSVHAVCAQYAVYFLVLTLFTS